MDMTWIWIAFNVFILAMLALDLGAFLVFAGLKMLFAKEKEYHPEGSFFYRQFQRISPVTKHFDNDRFFVRREGIFMATPLFMVLVLIEATDLVFAVDSIPAIFGVTTDSFLVYASKGRPHFRREGRSKPLNRATHL